MNEELGIASGKFPIIADILSRSRSKNIPANAIKLLRSPGDIRAFIEEYADFILDHSPHLIERENSMTLARQNIGLLLPEFPLDVDKLWRKEIRGTEPGPAAFGVVAHRDVGAIQNARKFLNRDDK